MIRFALGLALIVLPFLEIGLLVKTAQWIGFWPTLALLIAAAVSGGLVLSRQSGGAFRAALEAASQGHPPGPAVVDALFLALAGLLLIVPGFITDVLGLLLLVRPLRHRVADWTIAGVIRNAAPGEEGAPEGQSGGPVIEGEFERLDERNPGGPG